MRYCVIDFETTGFAPPQSEVIEFAAVRVEDGEIGLHMASLCRPCESYISGKITQITGITPMMVMGSPVFEELLPSLLGFIGNDTVVCHNVPFDMSFLGHYCRSAGIDFSPPTLCTLALARKFYSYLPSRKLEDLARHLNVEGAGYHRALADAMTTAKVLIEMMRRNDFSR